MAFLKILFLYRKQIFILFILSLFSSLFMLVGPYLSQFFIDKAFIGKNLGKFLNLSILSAAVFIFSIVINAVSSIVKNRISIKLKLNLANSFIKKFYSQDLSFFQSKSTGENVYRLSNSDSIVDFLVEQCPQFFADIFKLPVILIISLCISKELTAALVILSPLFLLHSVYTGKKLKPLYEEIWKRSASLSKEIYDSFSKILIIKAFGLEFYRRRAYLKTLIENTRWKIRCFRLFLINSLTSAFLSKAVYALITFYGGWLIIKGKISLGSYTACMLYLNQSGGLLQSLGNRFDYFISETVSCKKFFEIAETTPKIKDSPNAKILNSIKSRVEFKDVCFGYNGKPIFNNISFKISFPSWIGIAGPSGSGKTTLLNLMLRLYEPQKGEILLDGLNLREIRMRFLREKVAIATQAPLLFDVSIKENIAYGLKHIDIEDIIEAAKISCIDDFISQLPKGYDTLAGEDACCLSGGLKQRIAIARAVLRKPDLLILDEATSSVDSITEERIFSVLRKKREGLTTIVVSHRLFSISNADKIYFLKSGFCIEEGTHKELLLQSKAYREFFENQLSYST